MTRFSETQPPAHRDRAHLEPPPDLKRQGLEPRGTTHWNLMAPALVEHAVRRAEGHLAAHGPFTAVTSPHTGRSPKDKFVVRTGASVPDVDWGSVNQPLDPHHFDLLLADVQAYLSSPPICSSRTCIPAPILRIGCGSATSRPNAWHALFVRNMFIRPEPAELASFEENFTVLHAPEFQGIRHARDTQRHVHRLHLDRRMILIGGTRYAGELKKSMFTVMNYLMPKHRRALHALLGQHWPRRRYRTLLRLSGTGKTTLSADPDRSLIGDDEHGWIRRRRVQLRGRMLRQGDQSVAEAEPDIFAHHPDVRHRARERRARPHHARSAVRDQSITENTRASSRCRTFGTTSRADAVGIPKHIVFLLTADAFGVLPPIARLSPEQAMYYFLSGYTAKVAGTERGVTEPQATFSACFGAVFLVWPPTKYAAMLGERMARHGARVWLVNTGWTGGPYGVGKRM